MRQAGENLDASIIVGCATYLIGWLGGRLALCRLAFWVASLNNWFGTFRTSCDLVEGLSLPAVLFRNPVTKTLARCPQAVSGIRDATFFKIALSGFCSAKSSSVSRSLPPMPLASGHPTLQAHRTSPSSCSVSLSCSYAHGTQQSSLSRCFRIAKICSPLSHYFSFGSSRSLGRTLPQRGGEDGSQVAKSCPGCADEACNPCITARTVRIIVVLP